MISQRGRLLAGPVGWVMGFLIGSAGLVPLGARPAFEQQVVAVHPQERALDANLYMQTAAEYRACCLQTYQWMTERLRMKLAAHSHNGSAPAVILDLDETVFDNSPFQSFLDRERLDFSDALWDLWERDYPHEVRLVPGARQFITSAEQLGVAVIYISNRLVKYRDSTIAALNHLELSTKEITDRLLLKEESSDKTSRRKLVEARYRVLLYAGDNLRDFSEDFAVPKPKPGEKPNPQQAILERYNKVERASYRWGTDWFIFPNPVYGEWQKPLGTAPRELLRPTAMKAPAK
jgi:5'-nucleotidase (lipoprotein e(P4) family)